MFSKDSKPHYLRTALSLAAVSALVAATGCAPGGSASGSGGGQVVVATYGGAVADAFQSVYFDDFTKETGIEVVQVPADQAKFVSMTESGKSDWDTIDAFGSSISRWAEDGLIQEMSPDVPRSDLVKERYADYAAGAWAMSYVLVYRKSAFSSAPQNWADFWDTKKYPGKRGWPTPHFGTMEAALLADGVNPDELYPLDFDRGLKKMDEIKPSLTVYESYAALTQGLQSGSVDMALMTSGRAAGLSQQDPDVVSQWNQNISYPWSGFSVAKGGPNADGMNKLLAFMQDPQKQAEFAEKTHYGPSLSEAYELISPETAKLLPGSDENSKLAVEVNAELLAGQEDEYIKRYSEWLAR